VLTAQSDTSNFPR